MSILMSWRMHLLGPPWFRKLRHAWDWYWSDEPFVSWDNVRVIAERCDQLLGNLSLAEEGLANYQQDNERLRAALQRSPCPRPIEEDDGTVLCCVTGGHCGCENAPLLRGDVPQPAPRSDSA